MSSTVPKSKAKASSAKSPSLVLLGEITTTEAAEDSRVTEGKAASSVARTATSPDSAPTSRTPITTIADHPGEKTAETTTAITRNPMTRGLLPQSSATATEATPASHAKTSESDPNRVLGQCGRRRGRVRTGGEMQVRAAAGATTSAEEASTAAAEAQS